jgi:hypothetical protein
MKSSTERFEAITASKTLPVHGVAVKDKARALAESMLAGRLGLLVYGNEPAAILELRDEILKEVSHRFPSITIIRSATEEDVIARVSRLLGDATIRGDDLQREGSAPGILFVLSGRLDGDLAQMRQLLRVSSTFPELGLNLLLTVSDHSPALPPSEFDTFGTNLHRHFCPPSDILSSALPDGYGLRETPSVELALRPGIKKVRNPDSNAGNERIPPPHVHPRFATDEEASLPWRNTIAAQTSSGVVKTGASPKAIGAGTLAIISLVALTIVLLLFPRHAQILRAWLLPIEAKPTPQAKAARSPATGPADGAGLPQTERSPSAGTLPGVAPTGSKDSGQTTYPFADFAPQGMLAAEKDVRLRLTTDILSPPETGPSGPMLTPSSIKLDEAVKIVRDAPASTVFVQFAAMQSANEVQQWLAGQKQMKGALVVPIQTREGQFAFAIVQGPFRSRPAAMEYSKTPGVPEARWLRSAASLKSALSPIPDSSGAADGKR